MSTHSIAARERILEAARKLFSERGYTATSTRELAKTAGVAEITIFRHFGSKDKLLGEVLNRFSSLPIMMELVPQLEALPLDEGLIILVERFYACLNASKDWIFIINSEIRKVPASFYPVYYDFLDRIFDLLARYFASMIEQGKMRDMDPMAASRAFHSMIYGLFGVEEILGRGSYCQSDIAGTLRAFIDVFYRGIVIGNDRELPAD